MRIIQFLLAVRVKWREFYSIEWNYSGFYGKLTSFGSLESLFFSYLSSFYHFLLNLSSLLSVFLCFTFDTLFYSKLKSSQSQQLLFKSNLKIYQHSARWSLFLERLDAFDVLCELIWPFEIFTTGWAWLTPLPIIELKS